LHEFTFLKNKKASSYYTEKHYHFTYKKVKINLLEMMLLTIKKDVYLHPHFKEQNASK